MPDRPKIGPTGQFPFGQPLLPSDKGGLYVAFRVYIPDRRCSMNFGTPVWYVSTTVSEALQLNAAIRRRIEAAWGKLSYNKYELPLKVRIIQPSVQTMINPGPMVQILLPQQMEILLANPEVFLSLAEVIEDRLKERNLFRETYND